MDNLEDIFSADEPTSNEEVEIETNDTPEVEITDTETEAESSDDPAVEEAKSDEPKEPTMLPLAAVLAERQKAREDRDELIRVRQQLEEFKAAKAAPVVEQPKGFQQQGIPDPYDDPQGYHTYVVAQARAEATQAFQQQNLALSRARAVAEYGEDVVNEAADWAGRMDAADPNFGITVLSQPDPARWVIEQKKRSEEINSFQSDREAFIRAEAAKLGLVAVSQEPVAPLTPATKPTGPKSLVNAKSINDAVTTKQEKDDFNAIFDR